MFPPVRKMVHLITDNSTSIITMSSDSIKLRDRSSSSGVIWSSGSPCSLLTLQLFTCSSYSSKRLFRLLIGKNERIFIRLNEPSAI
jgi:hypothetical protein